MPEFWSQITNGFMPHGFCLQWNTNLVALLVASNLMIALAYYSIPVTLIYIVVKRKIRFGWVLWMFGAFIFLCGTTHVMAIVTIWHGSYWLEAMVNAATALVSLVTAITLWPLAPRFLSFYDAASQKKIIEKDVSSGAKNWMIVCLVMGMLAVVVVGCYLYQQCLSVVESRQEIFKTQDIISAITELRSALNDMETSQRGFVITGKHSYLEPYEAQLKTIPNRLAALRMATVDDPKEQPLLVQLEPLINGKLAELKETVLLRQRDGFGSAAQVIQTDRGNKLMDGIRSVTATMLREKSTEFRESNLRLDARTNNVVVTFVLFAVSAIALFSAFGYFMSRYLSDLRAARDADMKLKTHLQKQAELIDLTHDTIMVRVLDGTIRFWNHGAEKMYGFTKEEAIGQKSHDLLKTEFPEPLGSIEELLNAQGRWDGELVHHTRDGRRLVVASRWSLKAGVHGEPVEILEINNDITVRKAAEEQMTRLAQIVECSVDAIIGKNLDGVITSWNSGAERIMGYSAEEVVGQPITLLIPSNRLDEERELFERVVRGERIEQLETVRKRKDGTTIEVSLSLSPIRDASGKFIGLSKVMHDITERKKSQDDLRNLAVKLESSNEELQQFAYVASHDLQEPLRTVISFCDLFAKKCRGQLDPDAQQYLGVIVESVTRMQQLIKDLLLYARVGTQENPQFLPVDVSKPLMDAIGSLDAAITESRAQITYDPMPTLLGDRSQLSLLFQNLISNSIKFRGQERLTVHIAVEAVADDKWQFSVSDNGIGMSMEYAERIFVIFQRLHSRTEYPGTGIGLAVCKRIVERHGGKINVESLEGSGSTFTFSLPQMLETK
ncbi:CHASE3 domain-containing protein [soil metagenome]